MDITTISKHYKARLLNESDLDIIYNLCKENKLYYHHCPPTVTYELIKEDMYGLPPLKDQSDKYYYGYFDNDKLIAVVDLIDGYPTDTCAYIGLFMLDVNYQSKGIGSTLFYELTDYLIQHNFNEIQLGYVKTNPQAKHFWSKLGFTQCKDEVNFGEYYVIPVSKKIQ